MSQTLQITVSKRVYAGLADTKGEQVEQSALPEPCKSSLANLLYDLGERMRNAQGEREEKNLLIQQNALSAVADWALNNQPAKSERIAS